MALYFSATEVVPNQSKTSQRTFASSWVGNVANADQAKQTATDRITQANSDLPLVRVSSTVHKIDDAMIRQAANSPTERIYVVTATFHDGSAKAQAFLATPETKAAAEQKVLSAWAKDHSDRGYGGMAYDAPWRATSTMQVDRATVAQAAKEIGLDVQNYARSVINTAASNPGRNAAVVYGHASDASKAGRAKISDAASLANTALRQYETLRKDGMPHDQARERVAQEVGKRFDNRARDTQAVKQVRDRSRGM